MTKGLHIERKIGMYGDCQRINAYVSGQDIGCAGFSATKLVWSMSLLDKDNNVAEFDVPYADDAEAAMQQVEALIRLFYRQHYPELHKVAARYLSQGDQVGSGETIIWVGRGVRTPSGKVEVILEKEGRRRTSIWGASTVITVRRAA